MIVGASDRSLFWTVATVVRLRQDGSLKAVVLLILTGSWGAKDEQFSLLQLHCKNPLSMKGQEFILVSWLRGWRRGQQTEMERVQFPSWSCTTMPRRKFRQLNQR